MEKIYVNINAKIYNKLAKKYSERDYAVKDGFYINTVFLDVKNLILYHIEKLQGSDRKNLYLKEA